MHVQSPGIVKKSIPTFVNDIYADVYSVTHHRCATKGKRRGLSCYFSNREKCPDFRKKDPDCVHVWVKFSIQNVVLTVSSAQFSKMFPCVSDEVSQFFS